MLKTLEEATGILREKAVEAGAEAERDLEKLEKVTKRQKFVANVDKNMERKMSGDW